ncbi:Uncharacterised protein [uncultured archaeon]|nr:Uncharacterised protein [uncultured archaeon]
MRLLADENIPLKAVQLLREKGHDILSIGEMAPKTSDEDILKLAEKDGRLLLTFDKDFGELACNSTLPLSCGIILFRIPLRSADFIAAMIAQILESRSDWPGNFAVVESSRIRLRKLTAL